MRLSLFTSHAAVFRWHVWRDVRRHPFLAALNVLSVALGIAVYLAIQIANTSANRSFAAGVNLAAGKAHLEIRGEIDETLWPALSRAPGVQAATPLVEGVVTLPDFPGEYLRVLGVDIFTNEPFRTFELGDSGAGKERVFKVESWLGSPGVALTPEFANRHGLAPGQRLRVLANSVLREVTVLPHIENGDSPAAAQPRFAAMDLGWAQELLGQQGRLTSVQILVENPASAPQIAEALAAMLPAHLTVAPPRQRSFQMQQMVSAFQLNLTALSMVSLLVGAFLIFNTISAAVVRRRTAIGLLRAIGASRWQVRALFLGEACLFGIVGVGLGAVAGVALAQQLVGGVARTISSLYLAVSIERTFVEPTQLAVAALLGLGAVIAGAWLPANAAARIDPIGALTTGAHAESAAQRAPLWHWLGVGALVLAWLCGWLALDAGLRVLGFGAAFFVLAAAAFFSPGLTILFANVSARGPALWRMAADHLGRSVHRHALTVAALAAAIAMMVGLTVMIFSFRESLNAWLDQTVAADLFIASASSEIVGVGSFVPAEAVAWLRAHPEVAAVDTFRELQTTFISTKSPDRQSAPLAVLEGAYRHNLRFRGGDAERKMARVFAGEAVAVTESFARKFRVSEGDRLTLATPRGPAAFPIAGTYADYSRDQGVIAIGRARFERFWDDPRVQSLAVYARPGESAEAVGESFREQFGRAGEFSIYSNRALRRRILSIFDQTFAVTYVLRTVAIAVAIAGIFLSVTTLVAERQRETGILRSIGASRAQVCHLFMLEAGMIGVIASGLGIAAGALLAFVLTAVVNPAFFGWSIELRFPWSALAATPLWIVPATLLAALYPAIRAAQAPIAEAVREE